jgi:hypothetical protein
MKKIVATLMVICVFTVTNFAGWIHTTRSYACDPETSEPGTCIWVDDHNRRTAEPEETESVIKSVVTFISDYNPFDYFLN